MGLAAQVVVGRVTNPSTTVTALTANSGDSFSVANFTPGSAAYLENVWASAATAGVLRVRSPRMHDNAQGIRVQTGDSTPRLLLPTGGSQPLYPSDALTVEMTGGSAETDLAALLLTYDDMPGIAASLAQWAEIAPRVRSLAAVDVNPTTSSTAGQWSSGRAINADFATLKSQTSYAILGYTTSANIGVVAVAGSATGNLRVGGPGPKDGVECREFYADVSRLSGRPYIPVINGSDAGAVLLYVADPATSTSVHVSLTVAELAG